MIKLVELNPIGIVHSRYVDPKKPKKSVQKATIEIYPQYEDAMLRMDEHSHIWVLGWFHEADRDVLRVTPRINKNLPEYGVFGIRAFKRPNPIGLSVVKVEEINGNRITVADIDFIDKTPVLDIKPYYERDMVSFTACPYIRPSSEKGMEEMLVKNAVNYHGEKCTQLMVGVKMAMVAEKELGCLTDNKVKVSVYGSPCLGDSIQGITRARLSNPPRFHFEENHEKTEVIWENDLKTILISLKKDINPDVDLYLMTSEIFEIIVKNK